MKSYEEVLSYLFGLERFGMVFGLENVLFILELLGNPQNKLRTIHVGGTNGKGSVTVLVSAMLEASGLKVGMYTSPHLISFTERIRVNGKMISEKEVVSLTQCIREKIEKREKGRFFTFFDFTTALAFEYFRRKGVDVAVVEVGLGGRLDSTNVITPMVSVITNVDYDHMDVLGNDIRSIAAEKAGIIKRGVPVVTGADNDALEVIEERARLLGSPVFVLGRDFSYHKLCDNTFDYYGIRRTLKGLQIGLEGDHQLINASLALCTVELLEMEGIAIEEERLKLALKSTKWEGRLETLRQSPLTIADGAHNMAGVRSLIRYLRRFDGKRKILVFGVLKDKEYEGMLKELAPFFDLIVLTRPKSERAVDPHLLKGVVREKAIVEEDLRGALHVAQQTANDDDVIIVTGSLYTVGEAKALMNEAC